MKTKYDYYIEKDLADRIADLATEAAAVGDNEQLKLCNQAITWTRCGWALSDNDEAIDACMRTLFYAESEGMS